MARPKKAGLDYYPMDVGFLRDKKMRLLRAEFGASSVMFVLYVLGKVYEEAGYYLEWDDDERCFAATELGESPSYVGEVLQGCLRRSLFDRGVFQAFGVLTSAGIQRRYLRGCEKRADIPIAEEYWLLDEEDGEDVPPGIRAKLNFFSVCGGKNPVHSPQNPIHAGENPQRKEKKTRRKHRTEEKHRASPHEEKVSACYLETYRSLCPELPPCLNMTEDRRRAVLQFEQELGQDQFAGACRKANASNFCRGEKGWKADFDFLIQPEKALRVLAGKYDNGDLNPTPPGQSTMDNERAKEEMAWLDDFLKEERGL